MSQEIVYTSAERGLREGSTGFCTVRSTRGMPRNLSSLLEQLTAYNHPFDPYQTKVEEHPVNFAHYVSRLGGQRHHILGRIANAPLDHTSRSNKLAHLIAFDEAELDFSNTDGPAANADWLNQHWVTQWKADAEPGILPDQNCVRLPGTARKPKRCELWEKVTGNAKWAAVLANTIRERGDKPVSIIFSREQKHLCLGLVVEALSLLPPPERWDVSFSTFYSGSLPTKVSCRWQFVLDSTDLARKARRSVRSNAIDLPKIKHENLEPEENELSEFAESSDRLWLRKPAGKKTGVAKTASPPSAGPGAKKTSVSPADDDFVDDTYGMETGHAGSDVYDLSSPPKTRQKKRQKLQKYDDERSLAERYAVPALVGLLVLGCVGVIVGPGLWNDSSTSDEFSQIGVSSEKGSVTQQAKAADAQRQREEQIQEKAEERRRDQERIDKQAAAQVLQEPVEKKTPVTESVVTELVGVPAPENFSPPPKRKPLEFIRKMGERLLLKSPRKGEMELAEIYVDSSKDCDLKILGQAAVLDKLSVFKITTTDTENGRTWSIKKKPKHGLIGQQDIGAFSLRKGKLFFKWDPKNLDAELRNCQLQLKARNAIVRDDEVNCTMREPEQISVSRLDFQKKVRDLLLLNAGEIQNTDYIRLDLTIDGLPQHHKIEGSDRSKGPEASRELQIDKKTTTIHLFEPQRSDEPQRQGSEQSLVEIEFSLVANAQKAVYLRRRTWLNWSSYEFPKNVINEETPLKKNLLSNPRQLENKDMITSNLFDKIDGSNDKSKGIFKDWREKVIAFMEGREKHLQGLKKLDGQNGPTPRARKRQDEVKFEFDSAKRFREKLDFEIQMLDEMPERLQRAKDMLDKVASDTKIDIELSIYVPDGEPIILVTTGAE
ncbi:MAG: hypothetical protein ABGZ35_11390 [Planctomycetaceae bacterium]